MRKEIVERLNYKSDSNLRNVTKFTSEYVIPNAISAGLTFKRLKKTKNNVVLDVGCRVGVALEVFNNMGFEVVGVDYVTAYVNECHRKGFKCLDCDASNISIEDGSIDFIFHRHVLEHLDDRKKNLLEMRRVLVPNGIIWLQVPIDKKEEISKKHLSPLYGFEDLKEDIEGLFEKIYLGFTRDYINKKETIVSRIVEKIGLHLYFLTVDKGKIYTKLVKKLSFIIYFMRGIRPNPLGNELLFIGRKK